VILPVAGVVCAVALGQALLAAPQGGQYSGGERRSVWNGVYTSEQAKRGETQYDEQCAACHQFDLQGDGLDVPALASDEFRDEWDGKTLRQMFDLLSKSMPQQDPGSLTPAVYADILAYILQKNEFPAGSQALVPDSAFLDAIAVRTESLP
jgi:mono/diheme cytochrome c family protein